MATYEEVATLASVLNEQLETEIQPDSLVHILEKYFEDEYTFFPDVPISEITEHVHHLIIMADALIGMQDGDSIEELEKLADMTAEILGVEA
jgi:hypothetical protein